MAQNSRKENFGTFDELCIIRQYFTQSNVSFILVNPRVPDEKSAQVVHE